MIYIIFDHSYECDGFDSSSNTIKYISTNKEEAIAFFNKYFSNPPQSEKWVYKYVLVEFEDGYSMLDDNRCSIIMKSRNECEDDLDFD